MQSIIGHNNYQYRVNADWGNLDESRYPVNNCHEMVMSKSGLLYMLTDEIKNNILVYNKDGALQNVWGNDYPGAHGLTVHDENGTEVLYLTDTVRHQVIKTTLDGRILMTIDYPQHLPEYNSPEDFKPTETAIADNGDIYVTDGYGQQFIIQYNSQGQYIRHWGGRGPNEYNFNCAHGIAIDKRSGTEPTLLITSRNDNAFRRFTLDGHYLSSIYLPGSFVCRPVVHGQNVYAAVFRSEHNQNFGSGYITILNSQDEVVSSPGATAPVYIQNKLQPQKKESSTFIHPHDVCVDEDENIYVPQWNSNKTYPLMLERQ